MGLQSRTYEGAAVVSFERVSSPIIEEARGLPSRNCAKPNLDKTATNQSAQDWIGDRACQRLAAEQRRGRQLPNALAITDFYGRACRSTIRALAERVGRILCNDRRIDAFKPEVGGV